MVDKTNKTWVGTWGGGLAVNSQEWQIYSTANSGISSNGITALTEDNSGKIWVGTFNKGISVFDGQNWETIDSSNSDLQSNIISSVYADGAAVWIGTNSGMARYENGQIVKFTTANTGIVFNQVNCFFRENNYLWIGTDGGLLRYDGSGFIAYNTANSGLPHNSVSSIDVDSFGNKWIGTSGGGLVEFNLSGIVQGVEDKALLADVQVYPNPYSERVNVSNNEKESLNYFITDISGAVLYKSNIAAGQKIELPLNGYASRQLFLTLEKDGRFEVLSLVGMEE